MGDRLLSDERGLSGAGTVLAIALVLGLFVGGGLAIMERVNDKHCASAAMVASAQVGGGHTLRQPRCTETRSKQTAPDNDVGQSQGALGNDRGGAPGSPRFLAAAAPTGFTLAVARGGSDQARLWPASLAVPELRRIVDGSGAMLQRVKLPASEAMEEPVPPELVPEAEAFKGWRDRPQVVSEPSVAAARQEAVSIDCPDKTLYPTHPQSGRKRYHRFAFGEYDHARLSGDSIACRTPSRSPTGVRPRCLRPDRLVYAMLSDTYTDSCGNTYRGYWDATFLEGEENDGTLMSKGRTVYHRPRSEFAGEVYEAQTYGVPASEFAFVTRLLPGDEEKIETFRRSSVEMGTHRYDPKTHTFAYVGDEI